MGRSWTSLLQAISGMGYQLRRSPRLDEECVTDRLPRRVRLETDGDGDGGHRQPWQRRVVHASSGFQGAGRWPKNMVELIVTLVMIQGAEKPTSQICGRWEYDAETGIFYKVEAWRPYPPALSPAEIVGDDYSGRLETSAGWSDTRWQDQYLGGGMRICGSAEQLGRPASQRRWHIGTKSARVLAMNTTWTWRR